VYLSSFVLQTGRVTCLKSGAESWICRQVAESQQQAIDPIASIRARLGQGQVTSQDESLEGRSVRCYRFVVEDENNEVCLIPDSGIPVRIRGGSTELRLVMLEGTVDAGVFTPPAPVGAA
jgi:hypothetical protein